MADNEQGNMTVIKGMISVASLEACANCVWHMALEIKEQQHYSNGVLTEHLQDMQSCLASVAGLAGCDAPASNVHDYIRRENVLGVFGEMQDGAIKHAWFQFCESIAADVKRPVVYGNCDAKDYQVSPSIGWFKSLGLRQGFLKKKVSFKDILTGNCYVFEK